MSKDCYHFCKDCIHFDTITTREERRDGHNYIVQKCGVMKYESWWFKNDYGKLMHDCPAFYPQQIKLEGI